MAACTLVDYKSVLRDICDSEELKIDSKYSHKIKETLQKLCLDGDQRFEKCYERVRKELEGVITASKDKNKEQPYFRGMFLYLAEKLPKVLKEFELPKDYDDPIIWQVAKL